VILRDKIRILPEGLFATTAIKTIYLPATIDAENSDYSAFDDGTSPQTIYFAGTQEEWKDFVDWFWQLGDSECHLNSSESALSLQTLTSLFALFR